MTTIEAPPVPRLKERYRTEVVPKLGSGSTWPDAGAGARQGRPQHGWARRPGTPR